MTVRPKLLLATSNQGKAREFRARLAALSDQIEICDLTDFDHMPQVVESGSSFQQNALIKAKAYGHWSGLASLADDSGLEVVALGGAPGIHSARYAGSHASDQDNINKLLAAMSDISDHQRQAQFVCSLALWLPHAKTIVADGYLPGEIARAPRGQSGFGYDPVFYIREQQKTLAEMTLAEKSTISHRAQACQRLLTLITPEALLDFNRN